MKMAYSAADVLKNHVVFELESIDRMYLNLCVPRLQREQAVAAFFRFHRGHRFASSALMVFRNGVIRGEVQGAVTD